MTEVLGSAAKANVWRLFASRAVVPAPPEEDSRAPARPWLSELSAPDPLARWASSFADLSSCWRSCPDPEWLLWLAARTCGPAEQRKPVVLCAAEMAALAQRGDQDTDPRVARAISIATEWAGPGADVLDLLAAECDAMDAAREFEQAADRAADQALALFRVAPRRRPSSYGMSLALGSWQRWREVERDRWRAQSAALAVRAAALPDDGTVTAGEWAGCVSQSAAFAQQAMSSKRSRDATP
ncbi:MAG: hypothetical protein ACRDOI_13950, partial [Trebonia sp.]